ncbi:hypothetical protein ACH5AJ_36510 [Streptomyces rochei]|uniref:hypothetical protein n=1 Tax=Streptomyces rochei TaxID=1928 RepID=UPI0037962B15
MADIVTVAEVKKQLNIPEVDDSQDEELGEFIASITDVIEDVVGPVAPRQITEHHDGGTEVVVLRSPPAISITSVTEAGTVVEPDGYHASLDAGVLYRSSTVWAGGRAAVVVTYEAGQESTPASIKQAAKELVAVNYRSQQGGNYSAFDRNSPEPSPGEIRLGFFIPNRVMQLLRPHRQDGWLP